MTVSGDNPHLIELLIMLSTPTGNHPDPAVALACLRCSAFSGSSRQDRLAQLALLARDLIQLRTRDWRLADQMQAQAVPLWTRCGSPGNTAWGEAAAVEHGRQLASLVALGSGALGEPRLIRRTAHRELSLLLKRHVDQWREQRVQRTADRSGGLGLPPPDNDHVSLASEALSPVEREVVATLKELGVPHSAVLEVQGRARPLRRQEEQLRRRRRQLVRVDIIYIITTSPMLLLCLVLICAGFFSPDSLGHTIISIVCARWAH